MFLGTEPSHHRMLPDEYGEKTKQSHRSRSPVRVPRERSEHTEQRKTARELFCMCLFYIYNNPFELTKVFILSFFFFAICP